MMIPRRGKYFIRKGEDLRAARSSHVGPSDAIQEGPVKVEEEEEKIPFYDNGSYQPIPVQPEIVDDITVSEESTSYVTPASSVASIHSTADSLIAELICINHNQYVSGPVGGPSSRQPLTYIVSHMRYIQPLVAPVHPSDSDGGVNEFQEGSDRRRIATALNEFERNLDRILSRLEAGETEASHPASGDSARLPNLTIEERIHGALDLIEEEVYGLVNFLEIEAARLSTDSSIRSVANESRSTLDHSGGSTSSLTSEEDARVPEESFEPDIDSGIPQMSQDEDHELDHSRQLCIDSASHRPRITPVAASVQPTDSDGAADSFEESPTRERISTALYEFERQVDGMLAQLEEDVCGAADFDQASADTIRPPSLMGVTYNNIDDAPDLSRGSIVESIDNVLDRIGQEVEGIACHLGIEMVPVSTDSIARPETTEQNPPTTPVSLPESSSEFSVEGEASVSEERLEPIDDNVTVQISENEDRQQNECMSSDRLNAENDSPDSDVEVTQLSAAKVPKRRKIFRRMRTFFKRLSCAAATKD